MSIIAGNPSNGLRSGTAGNSQAVRPAGLNETGPNALNYIGTRTLTGTYQNTFPAGANPFTWSLQAAVPEDFCAIRLILMNGSSSAITGVIASASAGGQAADSVNNGGAWVNATFGGAASVTLPAAASTSDPTITLSDWIMVPSIPRTDGGTKPLAYVRAVVPGGNPATPLIGMGATIPDWATQEMLWVWRFQQGDFVTTPTGMTAASDPSASPVAGIQYLSANSRKITSVAFFGDSITSSYLLSPSGNGWPNRTTDRFGARASCANLGWAGQTSAQYLARAIRAIPALRPTVAFYAVHTPNDGVPTAAIISAQISRVAQFIDVCRQNGTTPVLLTSFPRATGPDNVASAYSNAQDQLRKQLNTQIVGSGVEVANFGPPASSEVPLGTASTWRTAADTIEGLHPSSSRNDAMATTALAVLDRIA